MGRFQEKHERRSDENGPGATTIHADIVSPMHNVLHITEWEQGTSHKGTVGRQARRRHAAHNIQPQIIPTAKKNGQPLPLRAPQDGDIMETAGGGKDHGQE